MTDARSPSLLPLREALLVDRDKPLYEPTVIAVDGACRHNRTLRLGKWTTSISTLAWRLLVPLLLVIVIVLAALSFSHSRSQGVQESSTEAEAGTPLSEVIRRIELQQGEPLLINIPSVGYVQIHIDFNGSHSLFASHKGGFVPDDKEITVDEIVASLLKATNRSRIFEDHLPDGSTLPVLARLGEGPAETNAIAFDVAALRFNWTHHTSGRRRKRQVDTVEAYGHHVGIYLDREDRDDYLNWINSLRTMAHRPVYLHEGGRYDQPRGHWWSPYIFASAPPLNEDADVRFYKLPSCGFSAVKMFTSRTEYKKTKKLMEDLSSPYLPKLYDSAHGREGGEFRGYLSMQYMDSNLRQFIELSTYAQEHTEKPSTTKRIMYLQIIWNMLGILCMLHEKSLVHDRLTPDHFLLTLKHPLTDYGGFLAFSDRVYLGGVRHIRETGDEEGEETTRQASQDLMDWVRDQPTTAFIAPEVVDGKAPTIKSNVYTVGQIAKAMIDVVNKFDQHEVNRYERGFKTNQKHTELFPLLAAMTKTKPEERPYPKELRGWAVFHGTYVGSTTDDRNSVDSGLKPAHFTNKAASGNLYLHPSISRDEFDYVTFTADETPTYKEASGTGYPTLMDLPSILCDICKKLFTLFAFERHSHRKEEDGPPPTKKKIRDTQCHGTLCHAYTADLPDKPRPRPWRDMFYKRYKECSEDLLGAGDQLLQAHRSPLVPIFCNKRYHLRCEYKETDVGDQCQATETIESQLAFYVGDFVRFEDEKYNYAMMLDRHKWKLPLVSVDKEEAWIATDFWLDPVHKNTLTCHTPHGTLPQGAIPHVYLVPYLEQYKEDERGFDGNVLVVRVLYKNRIDLGYERTTRSITGLFRHRMRFDVKIVDIDYKMANPARTCKSIKDEIKTFIEEAKQKPGKQLWITIIGRGRAGPLAEGAPQSIYCEDSRTRKTGSVYYSELTEYLQVDSMADAHYAIDRFMVFDMSDGNTLERPVSERIAELEKIPIAEPDVDLEEDFTQREEAVKHDRSETEDETDTDTSHRLRRSILTPVNATILRGKRGMVPGDTFFGLPHSPSMDTIFIYSSIDGFTGIRGVFWPAFCESIVLYHDRPVQDILERTISHLSKACLTAWDPKDKKCIYGVATPAYRSVSGKAVFMPPIRERREKPEGVRDPHLPRDLTKKLGLGALQGT